MQVIDKTVELRKWKPTFEGVDEEVRNYTSISNIQIHISYTWLTKGRSDLWWAEVTPKNINIRKQLISMHGA